MYHTVVCIYKNLMNYFKILELNYLFLFEYILCCILHGDLWAKYVATNHMFLHGTPLSQSLELAYKTETILTLRCPCLWGKTFAFLYLTAEICCTLKKTINYSCYGIP